MAEFQQLQLDPAARPTDQFAAPEVRRKLPGTPLMQLAGALSDFSSSAGQILERRQQAYEQSSRLAADRDFAQQNASGNLEGFRQAVKSGHIHEVDNPWYRVQASQDIARNDAKTAYEAAWNAYNNSPVKKSDDPRQVSAFIDQQFAPYLQGRDAWEVQAMMPELNEYKNNLIQTHIAQRRTEIENDRTEALQGGVRATIDPYTSDIATGFAKGDADATHMVSGIVAALQARMNEAGKTMDWTKVNALVSQSILDAAREKRDPTLGRILMDRIQTRDGQPLSKLGDNRTALDLLPRQIMELQVTDASRQEQLYELRIKKDFHSLMDAAKDWSVKNGNTDMWNWQPSMMDLKDKLPEAIDEYLKSSASASAQNIQYKNDQWQRQGEPVLNKLWTETLSPAGIDPKEQADLMSQLIRLGTFGREAVSQYDYFIKSHRMGTFIWGDTSPQTMAELTDKLNDKSLNPVEFRKYLLDLAANRQVSEQDFKWAMLNHHDANSGGAEGMTFAREMQMVGEQIQAGYTDPNNKNSIPLRDIDRDDNYWRAVAGAKRELQDGLIALHNRDDFKKMGPDQQLQQVKRLVDEVATHHGGWTAKQLTESTRQGSDPLEAMGLKGPNANKPLGPATPVEPIKNEPKAPETGQAMLEKADPGTKALQPYERNALQSYLKDPIINTSMLGHDEWQNHIERIVNRGQFSEAPTNAGATEQLAWIRNFYPDWSKVKDYKEGTTVHAGDSFRSDFANEKREIELANQVRQRMTDLKPVAEVARKELESILSNPDQPVTGTAEWMKNRDRVIELSDYVEEYSTLRKLVGFTPQEVKAAGSDAWKSMPMFCNEAEIKEHGEAVSSKFGIKDAKGKADFIAHQITLTRLLRNTSLTQ